MVTVAVSPDRITTGALGMAAPLESRATIERTFVSPSISVTFETVSEPRVPVGAPWLAVSAPGAVGICIKPPLRGALTWTFTVSATSPSWAITRVNPVAFDKPLPVDGLMVTIAGSRDAHVGCASRISLLCLSIALSFTVNVSPTNF